jgi:hypothetical protein
MCKTKQRQSLHKTDEFFKITHRLASQTENMLNDIVLEYIGFDYEYVNKHRELYLKSKIAMNNENLVKQAISFKDVAIVQKCVNSGKLEYNSSREIIKFGSKFGHTELLRSCINQGYSSADVVKHCTYNNRYDVVNELLHNMQVPERLISESKKSYVMYKRYKYLYDSVELFVISFATIVALMVMLSIGLVIHNYKTIKNADNLFIYITVGCIGFLLIVLMFSNLTIDCIDERHFTHKHTYYKQIDAIVAYLRREYKGL